MMRLLRKPVDAPSGTPVEPQPLASPDLGREVVYLWRARRSVGFSKRFEVEARLANAHVMCRYLGTCSAGPRMPPNVAAVAQSKSKGLEVSGWDAARVRGDTERPDEVVRQHALLLVPNPYTQPRGHISHRQDRRDSREQRRRLVERARVAHSGLWCRAVGAASGRARPRRSHAPRRTDPTCTPTARLITRKIIMDAKDLDTKTAGIGCGRRGR